MKTLTVIFALVTVVFAAPAFADHNRFFQGQKHGHWTELSDDGDLYEGHYRYGKRHGPWTLRFADGNVNEGPFVDGKEHGQWTVRFPDGTVKYFTYRNGEKVE